MCIGTAHSYFMLLSACVLYTQCTYHIYTKCVYNDNKRILWERWEVCIVEGRLTDCRRLPQDLNNHLRTGGFVKKDTCLFVVFVSFLKRHGTDFFGRHLVLMNYLHS